MNDILHTPPTAASLRAAGLNPDEWEEQPTAPLDRAPDPYRIGLAALRAAASPSSTFERDYKADRLRDLASAPERVAALRTAHEGRERTATYAAPDPYREGLDRLKRTPAKEQK